MWGCRFVKDGRSKRGSVWLWVCWGGAVCVGLWRWDCGLLQTKEKKRVEKRRGNREMNNKKKKKKGRERNE